MSRSFSRSFVLLLASAALAAFSVTEADDAKKKPAPAAQRGAKEGENSPEAPRTQKARGVTVLIENWTPPVHPTDFPRGVTVLIERADPSPEGPIVRVQTPAPPAAPAGEQAGGEARERLPEARRDLLADPAAEIEERRRRPQTAGPELEQQLEAFPRPPRRGGSPLPEMSGWVPESAWGAVDTSVPYPWNPARFDEPAFDPEWRPRHGYPKREADEIYPWQPAVFSEWIIDPRWRPSDAWGRQLGPPAEWLTLAPSQGARHDLEAFRAAAEAEATPAKPEEGSADGGSR